MELGSGDPGRNTTGMCRDGFGKAKANLELNQET